VPVSKRISLGNGVALILIDNSLITVFHLASLLMILSIQGILQSICVRVCV